MYEAWTEGEQEFQSLSSDYGYDNYGSEFNTSDPEGLQREGPQLNQPRQSGRGSAGRQPRKILPDQSDLELAQ